jgi:hypothetical protein
MEPLLKMQISLRRFYRAEASLREKHTEGAALKRLGPEPRSVPDAQDFDRFFFYAIHNDVRSPLNNRFAGPGYSADAPGVWHLAYPALCFRNSSPSGDGKTGVFAFQV